MGQKVNSNGLRYGIYKEWQSRWIASSNKEMALWLVQDDKIRKFFFNKYKTAEINNIEIERNKKDVVLFIHAAQPGIILEPEVQKKIIVEIAKIIGRQFKVILNVIAIPNTYVNARILAREIANDIERRVSFRIAQKLAIKKAMRAGALGIKTRVSGRLGGVEMAREEGYSEGIVTLSTLRTDIDYALEEAHTTYGIIGVKVWVNRGEIFRKGEISKICLNPPSSIQTIKSKPMSNKATTKGRE